MTKDVAWLQNRLHYSTWCSIGQHLNKESNTMKIAFIPKASYTIGQIITVHGEPMRVESYTHTGKNVTVCTLPGAKRFARMVCICTDAPAIEGVTA